jgi:ankyrin repeat protein
MALASLPQDPDLGQLRKQARELQRAVRAGDPDALGRLARSHPTPPEPSSLPLTAAQLVLAREHGFASWARLRRHVEVVTARRWVPGTPPPDEPLPDRFLRLACLTYGDEDAAWAARAEAARQLLAEHPELPGQSVLVAAACADVAQVRRHLAAAPPGATTPGGPYGWSPLLYQAYARHDPGIGREATLATAQLLLDAGADPNDGRFWHGLPTPFTVLTGVFGRGEQDQPPHPHALAFARLLLAAGADPNDGQALYNRMFRPDDDHLVLLFEHGLGHDLHGPWYRLLGEALEPPAEMLRVLLAWAIHHDQRARVVLLAEHGVDLGRPFTEGRVRDRHTPVEMALLDGHRELAALLRSLGAPAPQLAPPDAFVAAVLAGDAAAVAATPAAVVAAVRRRRSGLMTWAASQGGPAAVMLLAGAGFDVDALGRSDIPSNEPWHTALHAAVEKGDVDLARALLALGANPNVRDARFHAPPLGWARHFGDPELIELLEPVTTGDEESS